MSLLSCCQAQGLSLHDHALLLLSLAVQHTAAYDMMSITRSKMLRCNTYELRLLCGHAKLSLRLAPGGRIGGDTMSVTSGVVSRIEVTSYVHGSTELLGVQTDAAINAGNSGAGTSTVLLGQSITATGLRCTLAGICGKHFMTAF